MPIQTTIYSLSGTSPFDVYICQFNLTGCFYIDTITSGDIPYTFTIPAPYDTAESYCVKVVDDQGCVISGCSVVNPTPTPTNTVTPTKTVTPSVTSSIGVSQTPTTTPTPTVTPTFTTTPTVTITPTSSQPLVEYYALVNGTYCCGDLPAITNMLVRRIGFPIQNGFVYYDGEGNCFTITSNTPTVAGPGYTDITTNFADCSACRNNTLTFFLAGYCYDGRMLADSGSPSTNCTQVQAGLGSATRYRSNYPYSYLFTGQWQTVDMYIIDITTNCLLVNKPISDGCQYWETNSLGIVSIGYPQIGFDCTTPGGCCPGVGPS